MYSKFYGLREPPFNLTPDPRFLYFSASHREALARMVFGVNMKRGFIVITGEVGTGKTTLIHALLNKLDNKTQTAFLFHAILGAKGLFLSICKEFGIAITGNNTKTELMMKLYDFLTSNFQSGGNAALIIDEAQNLKPHILEEIRLLSNLETSRAKMLQILLVGQPEFGKILNRPEMRQLKQRVALRYHLTKLSCRETEEYINHRVRIAGQQSSEDIFSQEAIDEIYTYTNGLPRSINILCDKALLMGYSTDERRVSREIVKKVEFEDLYSEIEPFGEPTPVTAEHEQGQQEVVPLENDTFEWSLYMADDNSRKLPEKNISLFGKIKDRLFFLKKRKLRTSIRIT